MLKKPGSDHKISGFIYKIRRKIQFLRFRGTLFHKKPKKERIALLSAERLKRSRRQRRKIRYSYRKLRYLYSTDQLFKFNLKKKIEFLNRHYSFLGNSKYLIIILNSTFVFLLAYVFVFLLKEATTAIVAQTFNIKSTLMYYDVEFLIRSSDWIEESVKVVFTTGPLFIFLILLVSIIVYSLSSQEKGFARLFLLWIIIHSIAESSGELIFGPLLNQGFGWVLDYLYYTDTTKMLFVIGIILFMITVGYFLARFLLLSGNIYFNKIGKTNRVQFLFSQIVIPVLLGTGILFCIKQPVINSFDFILESSMLLVLVPAVIHAAFSNDLFFDEDQRKISIKWWWIFITLITFILFRIFLWKGIRI